MSSSNVREVFFMKKYEKMIALLLSDWLPGCASAWQPAGEAVHPLTQKTQVQQADGNRRKRPGDFR